MSTGSLSGSSSTEGAFAPANPTDGRAQFDYLSKWPPEALAVQTKERHYLVRLWVVGLVAIFILLKTLPPDEPLSLLTALLLVFFSGLLGGTTFDVKWFYHSVAKGLWHLDRSAWRLMVPWVSALVATFLYVLFTSDLIGLINPAALGRVNNILAFGFLSGYFSDHAIAKAAEIADSLFGASRNTPDKKRAE